MAVKLLKGLERGAWAWSEGRRGRRVSQHGGLSEEASDKGLGALEVLFTLQIAGDPRRIT